jgi:hypothetical protein
MQTFATRLSAQRPPSCLLRGAWRCGAGMSAASREQPHHHRREASSALASALASSARAAPFASSASRGSSSSSSSRHSRHQHSSVAARAAPHGDRPPAPPSASAAPAAAAADADVSSGDDDAAPRNGSNHPNPNASSGTESDTNDDGGSGSKWGVYGSLPPPPSSLPVWDAARFGSGASPSLDPRRRIYCNRSLNMAGVRAVGFDLDYTLASYRPETFEALAHAQTVDKLVSCFGYPPRLKELGFEWRYMTRGLIMDKKRG